MRRNCLRNARLCAIGPENRASDSKRLALKFQSPGVATITCHPHVDHRVLDIGEIRVEDGMARPVTQEDPGLLGDVKLQIAHLGAAQRSQTSRKAQR